MLYFNERNAFNSLFVNKRKKKCFIFLILMYRYTITHSRDNNIILVVDG